MSAHNALPASMKELLRKYAHTLDRMELLSRAPGTHPGMGRRPGTTPGFSVEFADYRKYNYGDDIRYIDWSIYARLRKLFLRQSKAEAEVAVHILLDASNSMSYGRFPKLAFAKKMAAMLGYVGLNSQDRVGVTAFSDRLHATIPPKRGRRQLSDLLALLEKSSPGGASAFGPAFRTYAARASSRGMLFVLSDCFCSDDYRNAFRSLAFSGFEVFVVRILAPEETNPELEEGTELRDLEHGHLRGPVVTEEIIVKYRKRMRDYSEELSAFCMREGFPYVETASSLPFDEITLRLLQAGIWIKQ
ncbi:MAG: DUF58 domain-containing protein [Acidobacteria bacterium]|nr:DUF58 domain-containing protein [Acidobacteriota bacterium]